LFTGNRKIGKNIQLVNPQFCCVEPKQFIMKDTYIEIRQMPQMNLIYCRHTGAFNQIGQAYEKLFKWAIPRGLVTPETKTVTVYHDDPAITSVDKVRQDASIIVREPVKVEGEIGSSVVRAGKYAVGHFELRETEFEQAWNTMCSWFSESGFQPDDGCTYELYHNHYEDHPDHRTSWTSASGQAPLAGPENLFRAKLQCKFYPEQPPLSGIFWSVAAGVHTFFPK
jgi:AraC family transcriptional regulator